MACREPHSSWRNSTRSIENPDQQGPLELRRSRARLVTYKSLLVLSMTRTTFPSWCNIHARGPIAAMTFLQRSLLFAERAMVSYNDEREATEAAGFVGFPDVTFFDHDGSQRLTPVVLRSFARRRDSDDLRGALCFVAHQGRSQCVIHLRQRPSGR